MNQSLITFSADDIDEVYKAVDFSYIRKKYDDVATRYAFDTMDGKRVNGYQIKAQMFRHLLDLKRSEDKEDSFSYCYDLGEVGKVEKFADIFPDIEDFRRTLPWLDFQRMIFCLINAWKREDGSNRYSKIILSMARANGKSLIASFQLDYDFVIKSYKATSQDFLAASIDNQQTQKLYGYVASTLRELYSKKPFKSLAEKQGVRVLATEAKGFRTNNQIETKSFNSGTFDSRHYKTAIADEVGELKDFEGIGKIKSGQMLVDDGKIIEISTAYKVPEVPYHKEQKEAIKALEAGDGLDRVLCLVFAQDSADEVDDPDSWIKSNPLLESSRCDVLMQNLLDDRDEKKALGNLDEFLVKNLNLWLNSGESKFLSLGEIDMATLDSKTSKKIKDKAVSYYQGIDYSIASDNTAIGYVYPYKQDGRQKWHLSQFSFIPWEQQGSIDSKIHADGVNYLSDEVKPYAKITSHELGLINPDEVYTWILSDYDKKASQGKRLEFFGYDSYGLTKVVKAIEANQRFNSFAIRQTASELSPAIDFIRRGFKEGTITIDDDPILKKALLNSEVGSNNYGLYIDKARASYKIDSVDAIIDAMYQAMYHFDGLGIASKQTVYDKMTDDEFEAWYSSPEAGYI